MLALTSATTTGFSYSLNPVLSLVLAVAFSVACFYIAGRKGRRKPLWAVLGFFFGIISLIVIAVLPSKAGQLSSTRY